MKNLKNTTENPLNNGFVLIQEFPNGGILSNTQFETPLDGNRASRERHTLELFFAPNTSLDEGATRRLTYISEDEGGRSPEAERQIIFVMLDGDDAIDFFSISTLVSVAGVLLFSWFLL